MTPPSTAQDFDAGWAALRAGDYETALSHLEPLALAGDDRAMVGMGYLYLNGFAVAENYTIAFRIFRDAADLGNTRSTRPGRCIPPSPDGGDAPRPPPLGGRALGIGVDQGHLFAAHRCVHGQMHRQGGLAGASLLSNKAKGLHTRTYHKLIGWRCRRGLGPGGLRW